MLSLPFQGWQVAIEFLDLLDDWLSLERLLEAGVELKILIYAIFEWEIVVVQVEDVGTVAS